MEQETLTIERYTGGHANANGLVDHYREHPKVKAILSKTGLKVVDVGCRVPEFLFFLFHDFACFEYFIGVELDTFAKVKKENIGHYKLAVEQKIKSVYDFYVYSIFKQKHEEVYQHRKLLTKEEFKKHFKIRYKYRAEQFIFDYNTEFSYMILANVLHLYNGSGFEWYYKSLFAKIKKGGLIYVRVSHEDNPNSKGCGHLSTKKVLKPYFQKISLKKYILEWRHSTKRNLIRIV